MSQKTMLERLRTEHDHILQTLNLLELQFLDLCRGNTPDYSIMRSIIVYIQEYPERAHHPLEDAIFSLLLERVEDNKLLHELVTDHTDLEGVTRKLRESLESLKEGNVTEDELKQQLLDFLNRQRRHIYIEETRVYPLVQSKLTEKDWQHVRSLVPLFDDPVFGQRTQADYERLFREINNK